MRGVDSHIITFKKIATISGAISLICCIFAGIKEKEMATNTIKKIFITLAFALLALLPSRAGEARVSLLTCSPGEEIYELFGHTALRYCDEDRGWDIVFGYGYFSFSQPNFVWRFILGETDYMSGAVDYEDFIEEYRERGAGVTEQQLNLDSLQTAQLLNALLTDCRHPYNVYRYNYFYNNCTTKVRDRILAVPGGGVTYTNRERNSTLRQAIAQHTAGQPWSALGMDLLLGADIDTPASRDTLQFLPGYLMQDFATARTANGTPVVTSEKQLLQPVTKDKAKNHFTPFNSALLLLLFTMITMLCEVRSRKPVWGCDIVLLLLQGLPGAMLLFMSLFSQHPAVGNNYLLLLLNPLPLLLLPFVLHGAIKKKEMPFMWVEIAMVALFVVTAPFVPQHYPAPIYIFAVTIFARSLFNIYRTRICELNLY